MSSIPSSPGRSSGARVTSSTPAPAPDSRHSSGSGSARDPLHPRRIDSEKGALRRIGTQSAEPPQRRNHPPPRRGAPRRPHHRPRPRADFKNPHPLPPRPQSRQPSLALQRPGRRCRNCRSRPHAGSHRNRHALRTARFPRRAHHRRHQSVNRRCNGTKKAAPALASLPGKPLCELVIDDRVTAASAK